MFEVLGAIGLLSPSRRAVLGKAPSWDRFPLDDLASNQSFHATHKGTEAQQIGHHLQTPSEQRPNPERSVSDDEEGKCGETR
jgi:hypothetical protein